MTAEIAILNKSAVALAADSIVTISGGRSDGHVKTYRSANKLFTLSKYHPVGVMIYGNADLMGVPWETLIKQYRLTLGNRSFPLIKDYALDLIKFLESLPKVFTPKLQEEWVGDAFKIYFFDRILRPVSKEVEKVGKKVPNSKVREMIRTTIANDWSKLEARTKVLKYLGSTFERRFRQTYRAILGKAIESLFKPFKLSSKSIRELHQIGTRVICGDMFPKSITGVVVAGFGDEQIFPAVWTFSPQLIALGRLIYRQEDDHHCPEIGHKNRVSLIPFAQRDVVDAFLRGISQRYLEIIDESMGGFANKYPKVVLEHIRTHFGLSPTSKGEPEFLKKIETETKTALTQDFLKKIEGHLKDEHVVPLLDVIAVLPKDELAAIAEALVNLTSVKRKIQRNIETVGGPIDVAVISKGDGFVWISRKHYFKPELNPHFTQNYLKESRDGKERISKTAGRR